LHISTVQVKGTYPADKSLTFSPTQLLGSTNNTALVFVTLPQEDVDRASCTCTDLRHIFLELKLGGQVQGKTVKDCAERAVYMSWAKKRAEGRQRLTLDCVMQTVYYKLSNLHKSRLETCRTIIMLEVIRDAASNRFYIKGQRTLLPGSALEPDLSKNELSRGCKV
jgi:hypothetical protein